MNLTDEALVEKFKATKDEKCFQQLVSRYQNRIYNAAFRLLGDSQESEDVVQDTFVRAYQNLEKFRHKGSFAAWLFRIVHNCCMDFHRSRERKMSLRTVPFDPKSIRAHNDTHGVNDNVVWQVGSNLPDPARVLDAMEQEELIASLIAALPQTQRIVIVLHDIEGFTYQEIADIVGTNIGTVRSRLHYGRLKVKETLVPYLSQNQCAYG